MRGKEVGKDLRACTDCEIQRLLALFSILAKIVAWTKALGTS